MGFRTMQFRPSENDHSQLLGAFHCTDFALDIYCTSESLQCKAANCGFSVPLSAPFSFPSSPAQARAGLSHCFGLFSPSHGLRVVLRALGGGGLCCARDSAEHCPSAEVIEFLKRPGDPFDYVHRKATSSVDNQAKALAVADSLSALARKGDIVGMRLAELEDIPQVSIRDPQPLALKLLEALSQKELWMVPTCYLVRFHIAKLARRNLTDCAFLKRQAFFRSDLQGLRQKLEELLVLANERDREWPESGTIMQLVLMQKLLAVEGDPETWWKSLFCYAPSLLSLYTSQYPLEKLPHYHHVCALEMPSLIGKKHLFELQLLLDGVYFALGNPRSPAAIQESAFVALCELLAAREDLTVTYLTVVCLEWAIHRGKLDEAQMRKVGILMEDLLNGSELSSNFRLCEVLASLLVKMNRQDQMTNLLDQSTFQQLELDKRVLSILSLSPAELCIEPPYCNLPVQDLFVDREMAIEQAKRQLAVRRLTTIAGESGLGKTALACKLALSQFNNFYIVWICDAETDSKLASSLRLLARRLNLPSERLPDFLPRLSSPKVLLILDNLCHSLCEELKPLLTGSGYFIITSSRNIPDFAVRLSPLELDTATDLAEQLSGRKDANMSLLCQELACVPLAVKLACKVLAADQTVTVEALIADVAGEEKTEEKVVKLIQKCTQLLKVPGARLLLQIAAQISDESIPVEVYRAIFRAEFCGESADAAVEEGTEWGLLQIDEQESLSIGRLTRMCILQSTSQEDKDALFSTTVSVLLCIFQRDDLSSATRSVAKVVETAVRVIHGKSLPSESEFHLLLQFLYHHMKAKGTYSDIRELYEKAVQSFTGEIKLSPSAALHLHCMSVIQLKAGKLEDAEMLAQASINMLESRGETHSAPYALVLSHFAAVLQALNRLVEAERFCAHALDLQVQLLPPTDPQIAATQLGLAGIFFAKRMSHEAEAWACRALQLQERALGPTHPDLAATLVILAGISQAQGKLTEAEGFALRGKAIQEALLGESHPKLALTYVTLAGLYQTQKKLEDAEKFSLKALRILESLYGATSAQLIPVLATLTAIFSLRQRLPEAERFALQRLSIQEASLGPNHPVQGSLYFDIAEIYQAQGKAAEAEMFALKALKIQENSLPRTHPQFATTYNLLASIYLARQKPAQAEKFALDALYTQEALYGKHDPELVHSYSLLSSICQAQGRLSDALDFSYDVLSVKKRSVGRKHPDLAPHYIDLAEIHLKADQPREAEKGALKALRLLEKATEAKNSLLFRGLSLLISIYMAQNRLPDAEKFYVKAMSLLEATSPTDVDELVAGYQSLASVCRAQGKHSEAGKYAIKARSFAPLT